MNAIEPVAVTRSPPLVGRDHNAREKPLVSVILPVHNEVSGIRDTVTSYYGEVGNKLPIEFIVAEDGSVDGTREVLSGLKRELPFVLLSDQRRKGYAKAVSDALRSCSGDWIFFSDADGQFRPSDFWNLWQQRDGCDMIVGTKVHRQDAVNRLILAKGFRNIVNALFHLNLHDSDSGFRLIRKEVIYSIIDTVRFLEYSFWIEFTVRACLRGFRVFEVPVAHHNRVSGESRIFDRHKIPEIILTQLKGVAQLYLDVRNTRGRSESEV